jgi:hypothetical protein
MPDVCSREAAAISEMMPVTSFTEATMSSIVLPASLTSLVPS